MTETMKAVAIQRFGGPEVLTYQDLPRPVPGEGELLIRAHAAGVNPVDWKTRSGSPPWRSKGDRFPLILGWDLSGVVAGLGPGVSGLTEGEAVYGLIRFPEPGATYAEYVTAPADQVLPKPATVDFLQAAALPLVSLTAWQALFEAGELTAGQSVLIHGAAGGVGHIALQLAKWRGARAIGTARGRDEDYLRGLGLDLCINFETTRFEEVVQDVDLVLDTVGGEVQERSWGVLKEGGLLVTLRTAHDLQEHAAAHGRRARHVLVRPEAAHFAQLDRLVAAGQLRPTIAAVMPLPEARQAHERLERGPNRGKIVLEIGADSRGDASRAAPC